MSSERLYYLRKYFDNSLVKVEIPVFVSETNRGKVYTYFDGERLGYKFNRGVAMVEKKDLHLFRTNFPHMIIHEEEGVR
ncbi:hypothetical protein RJD24_14640 [Bacillaceae bacterium IKA-2]|nr:hypothetical protein RJD24_14640 [Bacillaceae bacterium IKA-2]